VFGVILDRLFLDVVAAPAARPIVIALGPRRSDPAHASPRATASTSRSHDLGGEGPVLLVSHATGFHGRCYLPMAGELRTRHRCIALDYRGHGDTPMPPGVAVTWEGYGDDATAVARTVADAAGTPVVAFGHSMGGACLLMAAHRDPTLFERLVLFEPIVFPPQGLRDPDEGPSPLIAGARRRRRTFPSFDDAIENYARKPPLGSFTHAALEAYVRYGFTRGDDGQVYLSCDPRWRRRRSREQRSPDVGRAAGDRHSRARRRRSGRGRAAVGRRGGDRAAPPTGPVPGAARARSLRADGAAGRRRRAHHRRRR
jgi:pimeloyl-ACP methyl ester carboxylesterase